MASVCFQNLSTVIENKKTCVKPKDSLVKTQTDIKSEHAMKAIDFQISMRNKKLNEKKKVFYKYAMCTSADELQDFLGKDIDNLLVKKKWKDLGACFKWKFIENYLITLDFSDKDKMLISKAFKDKLLINVEYDIKTNTISKLNYEINGVIV